MVDDPKTIVAQGYDEIADTYLERFGVSTVRRKWVDVLITHLPAQGGRVLDLGCGAGIPVARDLAARGHAVTGVDGSARQIRLARKNVADATFIEADMCEVEFEPESFDAVGAFYAITHIHPDKQPSLISRISEWLKPGGVFVASFGAGTPGEWVGEWLGTRMYFGHDSEASTLRNLADVGLTVHRSAVVPQDNEDTAFLWIVAFKG